MKKILFCTLLLMAGATQAQTTTYTLADVAQHATATDCWMVLNTNHVYNFTPFISMHPGGAAMVPYCGKDGTKAFTAVPHSSNAVSLETPYLIGDLAAVPAAISVTLAPGNSTTSVGGTIQFTPTVANSTEGVVWTIAPASLGTISASGLFTATAVGGGTITAASLQDSTKSASATVTVSSTPTPTTGVVTVTITPSALTLNQGRKMHFRAMLTNSKSGVTWTTTGSIGTIDARGLFTAGQTAGTGTVTATSVDDPTKVASSQVTITTVTCGPVRQHRPMEGHDD